MPRWLYDIFYSTLGFGAFSAIVLWGQVWLRAARSRRLVPTLRLGEELARRDMPAGRVCVVVPAYNEARVIAELVESLRAETYPQMRVVLALDRCTDDTAAIARAAIAGDARFEIVEIDACPPNWAGKVHAVHAGVTRSQFAKDAEYLIFADADTVFEPGCIAASLALMNHRRLDLLSLLSTLTHETWFEQFVQTAAVVELLTQYPLPRANAEKNRRAFANGQFMLFRRDVYDAVGGHAAVKGALLEDLALAQLMESAGHRSGVFLAAGLLHCRMYSDWAKFRRGWKRIFTEAANRKPRKLSQAAWRNRWLGTFVPLWTLAAGVAGAAIVARDPSFGWPLLSLWAAGTLLWFGSLLCIATMSRAPVWTAPFHIVGAWLVAGLLDEAARDLRTSTPTTWGGREYDLRGHHTRRDANARELGESPRSAGSLRA